MKVLIHERPARQVENLVRSRGGSYIFHGATGVGKKTTAVEISRRLNCLGDEPKTCRSCLQHASWSYPDLMIVSPGEKPSIAVETVRGLIQSTSLALYHASGIRVVIIDDAHSLTPAAQNALLKIIEEPPPSTIFILTTSKPKSLLTTVHSRCMHVYFPAVESSRIQELLESQYQIKTQDAKLAAAVSDGAPGLAVTLSRSPEESSSRKQLQEWADHLMQNTLFERLLLSKKLVDSKIDVVRFGNLVHGQLVAAARSSDTYTPDAPSRFEALERFRRAVDANVSSRVALDRLMLEL